MSKKCNHKFEDDGDNMQIVCKCGYRKDVKPISFQGDNMSNEIENKKCYAYMHDGRNNHNCIGKDCQWYPENGECIMLNPYPEDYEDALTEIKRLKDEKEELKEQVDILGKDNEDVYKYVAKNIDLKERHKKEKEKMLDELEKKIMKILSVYDKGNDRWSRAYQCAKEDISALLTAIKNKYKER